MGNRTPVEIPYSSLEYIATFEQPMLELVGRLNDVIVPFVKALAPWGFTFEETDLQMNSPKPKEHCIIFQRPTGAPPPVARVELRWSKLTVWVDQPDWSDAESVARLCTKALETIIQVASPKVQQQQIQLMMHVQSQTTPRARLTEGLLTPLARDLMDGEISGQGIILHRDRAMILIDNSAALANGLFVRMNRTFDASTGIPEMAVCLRTDEERLWDVLNLEGAL